MTSFRSPVRRVENTVFIPFKTEEVSDFLKTKLLSMVHLIFDPLDFIVPVFLPAKGTPRSLSY